MKKPNYDAIGQKEFLNDIAEHFDCDIVTSKQINEFIKLKNLPYPHFLFAAPAAKAGWGKYRVRTGSTPVSIEKTVQTTLAQAAMLATVTPLVPRKVASNATDSFFPEKDVTYVPFGFYNDLKQIIGSKIFYPVYITGLSGNGKTVMVEQICAAIKREMIRVNITKETDETDLIGSYELIDGNTVRREGPVVVAMRRGAVLLLDETDYGSERLLCLQPILEGKPYFDKKTGELIAPTPGFNVIATANTKGKGSDDGRFIGANTLNEAFLERFAITVEQKYPSPSTEKKILQKNFEQYGITDLSFADRLVTWAEIVRKSYLDGAVEEIISTRRLVHITKAYSIFNNRLKAIELCLNRFDSDTKKAFLDLYTKVDADATPLPANTTQYVDPDNMVSLPEDQELNDLKQAVSSSPPPQPPTRSGAWFPASQFSPPITSITQSNPSNQVGIKFPDDFVAPQESDLIPAVVSWASPKDLIDASLKYNCVVSVKRHTNTGYYYVISHGYGLKIRTSNSLLVLPSPTLLDDMVNINRQRSENNNITNPYL